jgi:hypothetical protein
MASWQFNLFLIPRVSLLNRYKHIPMKLYVDHRNEDNRLKTNLEAYEIDDALDVDWWTDLNIYTSDLFPIIEEFAALGNNWSTESLKNFGDSDKNDIHVHFNKDTQQIEEVSCRFDLRELNKEFIDKSLLLAQQFNCLLMDNDGILIQPNLSNLFELIKSSNAFRFVSDPEKYLDDISNGRIQL